MSNNYSYTLPSFRQHQLLFALLLILMAELVYATLDTLAEGRDSILNYDTSEEEWSEDGSEMESSEDEEGLPLPAHPFSPSAFTNRP